MSTSQDACRFTEYNFRSIVWWGNIFGNNELRIANVDWDVSTIIIMICKISLVFSHDCPGIRVYDFEVFFCSFLLCLSAMHRPWDHSLFVFSMFSTYVVLLTLTLLLLYFTKVINPLLHINVTPTRPSVVYLSLCSSPRTNFFLLFSNFLFYLRSPSFYFSKNVYRLVLKTFSPTRPGVVYLSLYSPPRAQFLTIIPIRAYRREQYNRALRISPLFMCRCWTSPLWLLFTNYT